MLKSSQLIWKTPAGSIKDLMRFTIWRIRLWVYYFVDQRKRNSCRDWFSGRERQSRWIAADGAFRTQTGTLYLHRKVSSSRGSARRNESCSVAAGRGLESSWRTYCVCWPAAYLAATAPGPSNGIYRKQDRWNRSTVAVVPSAVLTLTPRNPRRVLICHRVAQTVRKNAGPSRKVLEMDQEVALRWPDQGNSVIVFLFRFPFNIEWAV